MREGVNSFEWLDYGLSRFKQDSKILTSKLFQLFSANHSKSKLFIRLFVNAYFSLRLLQKKVESLDINSKSYSVVVITSALHAEGRGFKPRCDYFLPFIQLIFS